MTPKQIALVQHSWSTISPCAEMFALLFRQRLSKTAPQLGQTFDLATHCQGPDLLGLFNTAIATLDLPENLTPALSAIGQRLREEGVGREDVGLARDALLWTLFRALPDDCRETQQAWERALDTLLEVIADGAAGSLSAAARAQVAARSLHRVQRFTRAERSG